MRSRIPMRALALAGAVVLAVAACGDERALDRGDARGGSPSSSVGARDVYGGQAVLLELRGDGARLVRVRDLAHFRLRRGFPVGWHGVFELRDAAGQLLQTGRFPLPGARHGAASRAAHGPVWLRLRASPPGGARLRLWRRVGRASRGGERRVALGEVTL